MTLRERLFDVIFGTDSPAGRRFDLYLIIAIVLSVLTVMLDSVEPFSTQYHTVFFVAEWLFTLLFTIEYLVRLYCSPNPWRYARSFYGIVDLLAILPTYLAIFLPQTTYLMTIRLLRVLRIFRILKLSKYLGEANMLIRALKESRRKVFLFLATVLVITTVFGSLMYIVEGPENGFSSIPKSVYWAIVTTTTVGYGDITPNTVIGQVIAAMVMITGYAIIAVPTGIFTAELFQEFRREYSLRSCPNCEKAGHERSAAYCKWCGTELPDTEAEKKPGQSTG